MLVLWNGISPAMSINKDVTAISDFRPPNVNELSQKGNNAWDPSDGATTYGDCSGAREGMWEIKTSVWWPQIIEMHIEEISSIIPDSCIFPYIEEH